MNKKTIIVAVGCVVIGLVFFVLIKPLFIKARNVSQEVKALDSELASIREALKNGNTLDQERHLLKRDEVSVAINEIMRVGADLNINFLSTNPQEIQNQEESQYPVLPIRLALQSTYQELGKFFGALERLNKSIVTVREFLIERKQEILPKIYTELTVDIYLKEGEGE